MHCVQHVRHATVCVLYSSMYGRAHHGSCAPHHMPYLAQHQRSAGCARTLRRDAGLHAAVGRQPLLPHAKVVLPERPARDGRDGGCGGGGCGGWWLGLSRWSSWVGRGLGRPSLGCAALPARRMSFTHTVQLKGGLLEGRRRPILLRRAEAQCPLPPASTPAPAPACRTHHTHTPRPRTPPLARKRRHAGQHAATALPPPNSTQQHSHPPLLCTAHTPARLPVKVQRGLARLVLPRHSHVVPLVVNPEGRRGGRWVRRG